MEIESLFSSTRWEILRALSKKQMSPMELASSMKTTSANISQQLRLLELAGLVKSEKISNVDKGKPRILYSLAGDNAFIIISSPSFAEKKMIALTSYHKYMMRTWFIENPEHHLLLSELYFKIVDSLDKIKIIAAESGKDLSVYIVPESQKAADALKKLSDNKKVRIIFTELSDLKKKEDKITVIYDPSNEINSGVVKHG